MTPSKATEAVIEVRGLAVGHGGRPLLEGLDFDVQRGSILAVLGGSGTGKSTLLRVMIGLDRPQAGSVTLHLPEDPYLPAAAPRFGVLFQSGALFGSQTLLENVSLPLQRWTRLDADAVATIAKAKLRLVGLESFEHHLPGEISGGMRKRAGIARALALEAPLLFLDEPSAGLDPITSVELDDLLLLLSRSLGVTVVVVTHELASLFRIGSDCILLDRATRGVIARGDPRTLRDQSTDPRVRAFLDRHPGEPQPEGPAP